MEYNYSEVEVADGIAKAGSAVFLIHHNSIYEGVISYNFNGYWQVSGSLIGNFGLLDKEVNEVVFINEKKAIMYMKLKNR